MLKKLAVRTLAAVAIATTLTTGVAPSQAAPGHAEARAHRSEETVLVIGDSLTARSRDKLRKLDPTWTIDAVRGRHVRKLDDVLAAHLAEAAPPDVLVIALGTNESHGWTEDDYVRVTQMVPETTLIVFVSTYRDSTLWGEARADIQGVYSAWMRHIARTRPLTTSVNWRRRVTHRPNLLVDGTHPTDPRGELVWSRMVNAGVDLVRRQAAEQEARRAR